MKTSSWRSFALWLPHHPEIDSDFGNAHFSLPLETLPSASIGYLLFGNRCVPCLHKGSVKCGRRSRMFVCPGDAARQRLVHISAFIASLSTATVWLVPHPFPNVAVPLVMKLLGRKQKYRIRISCRFGKLHFSRMCFFFVLFFVACLVGCFFFFFSFLTFNRWWFCRGVGVVWQCGFTMCRQAILPSRGLRCFCTVYDVVLGTLDRRQFCGGSALCDVVCDAVLGTANRGQFYWWEGVVL